MKCIACGETMTTKREDVPYAASGLPGVKLHGVEVSRCKACDEYEVAIPRIEQLHRVIASGVAAKRARLSPQELRFLRKYLGLSAADFARRMDVSASQVSRWEQGHERPSAMAERLLRLMVVTESPVKDYSTALFDEITNEEKPIELGITNRGKTWELDAVA